MNQNDYTSAEIFCTSSSGQTMASSGDGNSYSPNVRDAQELKNVMSSFSIDQIFKRKERLNKLGIDIDTLHNGKIASRSRPKSSKSYSPGSIHLLDGGKNAGSYGTSTVCALTTSRPTASVTQAPISDPGAVSVQFTMDQVIGNIDYSSLQSDTSASSMLVSVVADAMEISSESVTIVAIADNSRRRLSPGDIALRSAAGDYPSFAHLTTS